MDMMLGMRGFEELLAERMLEAGPPHMNHFRDDRDGNLFRQHRADIQADRHVNPLQPFPRNSFALELFNDRTDFAPAPDHTDISRIRLNRPPENVLIFLMAARDD